MKINIVCVGKIKENYFKEGIEEYRKRLSRFNVELNVVEVSEYNIDSPKEKEIELIKTKETERIIKAIKSGPIIALDKDGMMITSEDMAHIISRQENTSSIINFIIGGSYGLDLKLLKPSLSISFGQVTYPHQLMRLILSEQIYRAYTIKNNITYHK